MKLYRRLPRRQTQLRRLPRYRGVQTNLGWTDQGTYLPWFQSFFLFNQYRNDFQTITNMSYRLSTRQFQVIIPHHKFISYYITSADFAA